MFFSSPRFSRACRRAVPALLLLPAAAPAQAFTFSAVATEAQAAASQTGARIMTVAQGIMAGDMAAIQAVALALSGLIAVIGLWLLVRRPRAVPFDLEQGEGSEDRDDDGGAPTEPEETPSVRLLEAIAAAKAQMSISEAEKKHAR